MLHGRLPHPVQHDILNKNCLKNVTYNNNIIEATLDTDKNGMLYISLPYYEGWNIYVDGIKTEKEKYLGGMGVNIQSGHHIIKMTYRTPYVLLGMIISITTLIYLVFFYIIYYKSDK